ncbi:MAG: hypothetical protein KF726_05305 [Anaerolineae bacterium]|nr:hypothetical protein [Anaerolineae bacterium]
MAAWWGMRAMVSGEGQNRCLKFAGNTGRIQALCWKTVWRCAGKPEAKASRLNVISGDDQVVRARLSVKRLASKQAESPEMACWLVVARYGRL